MQYYTNQISVIISPIFSFQQKNCGRNWNVMSTRRTNSKDFIMPNTHSVLDLYTRTVLQFGHALFLSDLVFESNHQSLESSLSHNVGTNSHTIAMQNVVGSGWFWRLHEWCSLHKFRKDSLSDFPSSSLRYMLTGIADHN